MRTINVMQLAQARPGPPAEPVAVIGAGIGGLTLAAVLATYGISCRLFEKTRQLTEVGAGLELSPNAVRPLLDLGLGSALLARAVPIEAVEIRARDGELVARATLGAECERVYGAPYLTLHRAHLHAALLSVTDPDRLHLASRVTSVRETADGAQLALEDGTVRRAEVVVGADGMHSAVRAALHRDTPVASGLVMYRGVLPAGALPSAAADPLIRIWLDHGHHFVSYPVAGGGQVGFAATVALGGRPGEELGPFGRVFAGWPGPAGAIAEAAGDMRHWPVHDRRPLASWSSRRVTLLGDAAHAMLPLLAQGTSQAVEDAVELAACLADAPRPDAGLACYAERRIPRTRALQRAARQVAATLEVADGPTRQRRYALLTECSDLADREPLFGHHAGRQALPSAV